MRFLYKRPKINEIQSELETVMDVMTSDAFIYIDLFIFSLILSFLLLPVFHSFIISILILIAAFSFFVFLFSFFFKQTKKKRLGYGPKE